MTEPPHRIDTLVAHADRGLDADMAIAPPIWQTAPFRAESAEAFAAMASTPRHHAYYTRDGNPTFTRVEHVVATLEGAEAALLTASGMGAISAAVLTLVGQGDHVVAQQSHYMGTSQLLSTMLPRFGASVTLVPQADTGAFATALRPNTKLIIVESPSNPLMALTDLAAVATLAHARGVTTLCDDTIATPVNQAPLRLGIDLVVHSATKFLGGHHDLTAGIVAGPAALIEAIWKTHVMLGAVPDPFAAWLLLRGLRTLTLRVRRQNETALEVATFLAAHPAVDAVHYPGLATHPQHALARRQMTGGFGGIMSFELRGLPAAQRFMDTMRLVSRAVSFGGFESLASHPAGMWFGSLGDSAAAEAGISPGLIRLAIGLEHPADLIADLAHALGAAREAGPRG